MKIMRTTIAITTLCVSATCRAAQPTATDREKQAAQEVCLAKAIEHYGSATTSTKPKKKKIGNVKGYSFRLKVGEKNKSVKCLADANGETVFYGGRR